MEVGQDAMKVESDTEFRTTQSKEEKNCSLKIAA